jgi:dephospho-CoA kinase
VHPATRKDGERWISLQKAPYAIREAALIFEAGLEPGFDYIIGVTAPEALRISRVIRRDRTSREIVLKRIRQQMNEEEKMKLCDFVIQNNEEVAVLPQVMKIHEHLLAEVNK